MTAAAAVDRPESDIVIYGCTPAGITAAIEGKRLGHTVTLICRDAHVGGMTTNGLQCGIERRAFSPTLEL